MMEDYKKLLCPSPVMSLQVTPFVSYRHAGLDHRFGQYDVKPQNIEQGIMNV